jgi:hypothetical protein
MQTAVAFALAEDYAGTVEQDGEQVPIFQGAHLATDEGSLDVGERLDEGNGTIVVPTSEPALIELLRALPALVEVEAPEDAPLVTGYDDASAPDLRQEARRRGLKTGGAKTELVDRLKAHDEAIATGDQEAAASETPETSEQEG